MIGLRPAEWIGHVNSASASGCHAGDGTQQLALTCCGPRKLLSSCRAKARHPCLCWSGMRKGVDGMTARATAAVLPKRELLSGSGTDREPSSRRGGTKLGRAACFGTPPHQIAWHAMSVFMLREPPGFSVRSVVNPGFLARVSTPGSPNGSRNLHQMRATIGGKPHDAGDKHPLPNLTQAARQPTALRANRKMWKTTA